MSPFVVEGVPGIGELVAGKYRIEGSLGEGGMGVVLAARHEAIGQLFAIKFLAVHDEERRAEAAARLLREARAAASLRGEHVVQVFDVGELPDGTPFIVMERLDGRDLADILRTLGSLPISDALALMVQACHAVSEAHRAGIVHRDLKPSNLFVVRRSDGSALVKVVDFGISKSLRVEPAQTPTLTGARIALGSPRYMSPEQVRDARAVDTRTDVWSLGVILYELVSGRPAFQAATYSGVYAAIVADAPPSLSSICPAVTPELESVLGRCLERDPAARLQSVDELRAQLEPWAASAVDFASLVRGEQGAAPLAGHETPSGTQPSLLVTQRAAGESSSDASQSATKTQVSPGAPSSGAVLVPAVVRSSRLSISSDGPATRRSASELPSYVPRPPARRGLILLALLGSLGVGVWLLRASPAPIAPPAPVRTAALSIESEPPGALVREGSVVYGVTPLQLRLPFPTEKGKPRVFLLELAGFRPYVIEQSEVLAPTTLRAVLVAEPRTAPPASAAPSAAPGAPRLPPRAAPPASAAPGPSADPHWDIRLSR